MAEANAESFADQVRAICADPEGNCARERRHAPGRPRCNTAGPT
jgi:hypothetical protein